MRTNEIVRLHPATDLFMMGVVYARITKVGKLWVHCIHDLSRHRFKIPKDKTSDFLLEKT